MLHAKGGICDVQAGRWEFYGDWLMSLWPKYVIAVLAIMRIFTIGERSHMLSSVLP